MRHVFVETNWVVGYAAPEHRRLPAARRLLDCAANGEVRLHLPSVCLTEGRHAIARRCQPRGESNALRSYVAWAIESGVMKEPDATTIRRAIDGFEQKVKRELAPIGSCIDDLRRKPEAIDVFALDAEMLDRAAELGAGDLLLNPFDQAILAAVLVAGARLRDAGHGDVCYCELDQDLQPWDKQGNAKQPLTALYDAASVWVYGDFDLGAPERPSGWPDA